MTSRCIVATLGLLVLAGCSGDWSRGSVCEGVACSGHGMCEATDQGPECVCEGGRQAAGLECVEPAKQVEIVSLQVSPEALSEGETAVFTLVVNGPAGDVDPVTATLETPDGVKVTDFKAAGPARTYTAGVSWAKLNALEQITFLQDSSREFTVKAVDEEGNHLTRQAGLTLTCHGSGACRGACYPEMVVDESLSFASWDDCSQVQCGQAELWPVECLYQPVAWLWMSEDQHEYLMSDVMADIEADGLFLFLGRCGEVGVEIHGGLARKFEKKAYKVKFNREGWFGPDPFESSGENTVVDPIGFKQLIFKAHWVDPSLMRDRLTHDSVRTAGGLAPRVSFANLMLNGRYNGLYAVTEAVLEDYFVRLGFEGDGDLYKAVNHNAHFGVKTDPMTGYEKKMNKDGDAEDLGQLFAVIKAAPLDFEGFQTAVSQVLDLDHYLAFTLVNAFSNNQDSFTKNYYLYHEDSAPFIIVNWDADATWGLNWDGKLEPIEAGSIWGTQNHLSAKMKKVPELVTLYSEMAAQAVDGFLGPEQTSELVDAVASEIAQDIPFEECRWEKETTFDEHLAVIYEFIQLRHEYWLSFL